MKMKTSAADIVITDDMLVPRSAPARIVIPERQPETPSPEKVDAIFQKLREVEDRFGDAPDKNHLVVAMIIVCLGRGFVTRKQIVAALKHFGRDPGHVAITLKLKTGNDPSRHLWCSDGAGSYRLFDPA